MHSQVYLHKFAVQQSALRTASLTLIGGLILFIISNIFLKLVLEPVQDMKKLIGEVTEETFYYANLYHNPLGFDKDVPKEQLKKYREGSEKLRRLSSKLRGSVNVIPLYSFTAFIFRLPSLHNVEIAARQLIFLHNSMFRTPFDDKWVENVVKAEKDIRLNLKIRIENS